MIKQRFLLAAAVLSLGFTALPALAQSSSSDTNRGASGTMNKQNCEGLIGAARDACLKGQITPSTPGRSEDAASREGGRTPGNSENAASRTGVPPGLADQPTGAGGTAVPKDKGPQN
jgi:hypothetical protein